MVTTAPHISLPQRLWNGLKQDWRGFTGQFTPPATAAPGLYTYRLQEDGGQRRIHLRVEADGAGVMFVDVTDVIHLNETAVTMTKMALEGASRAEAESRFLSHFRTDRAQLQRELRDIYDMVDKFSHPGQGCPTCSLSGLDRALTCSASPFARPTRPTWP
jgi:hypothetical protein